MPKRVFFLFLMAIAMTTAAWAAGQTLTVRVRETPMRSDPSFTGKPGATLSYGQTVIVLEERDAWVKARGSGGEGWVHGNALTERRLILTSGARNVSATADEREVAAAGKGFSAEVERAYREDHPAGYAEVEAMLRVRYSPAELRAFLAAGKIVPMQEAAR